MSMLAILFAAAVQSTLVLSPADRKAGAASVSVWASYMDKQHCTNARNRAKPQEHDRRPVDYHGTSCIDGSDCIEVTCHGNDCNAETDRAKNAANERDLRDLQQCQNRLIVPAGSAVKLDKVAHEQCAWEMVRVRLLSGEFKGRDGCVAPDNLDPRPAEPKDGN